MGIKNRDTFIPIEQADIISDAAVHAVLTPVDGRDLDKCIRLNEPYKIQHSDDMVREQGRDGSAPDQISPFVWVVVFFSIPVMFYCLKRHRTHRAHVSRT